MAVPLLSRRAAFRVRAKIDIFKHYYIFNHYQLIIKIRNSIYVVDWQVAVKVLVVVVNLVATAVEVVTASPKRAEPMKSGAWNPD